MKTVHELEAAFHVYFDEMAACEQANCFWALLHLAVVLPDICAALQFGVRDHVEKRYVAWCRAHYPANPKLTEHDRYCLRKIVLHEGTSRADKRKCQYETFSFVDRRATPASLHLTISPDGTNVVLDVQSLAEETRTAVRRWFAALQLDGNANRAVERNLPRLVRVQVKKTTVPIAQSRRGGQGTVVVTEMMHPTTSST